MKKITPALRKKVPSPATGEGRLSNPTSFSKTAFVGSGDRSEVSELPSPLRGGAGGGVIFLLALSLALSIYFALHVPFGANPDETAHRDYIRLLIQNHGFVRFVPMPTDTNFGSAPTPWESHQPPLYYLLCVPVYLLSGSSVFAVRMVSAIIQLATIFLAFRAARDLFPKRPEVWWGVALFVTLLPTQAQLSAAISNDGLTTLLCVALFWRMGRLVQKGQTVRDAAIVAGLFAVGLLTKTSVLQLVPALILAYVLAVRAGKISASDALRLGSVALFGGLAFASPWLIRNTLLYGDPLALSIYKLTGPNLTPGQVQALSGWTWADYARQVGVRSFATFWYLLPPNLPFTRFAGPPLPLLAVVVLALGGAAGTYQWAKLSREAGEKNENERQVVGWFACGIALLVPFFVQFVLSVFQAQGRYFLPVLLPTAVLTVLGWTHWTKAKPVVGVGVVAGVLLLLTVWEAM